MNRSIVKFLNCLGFGVLGLQCIIATKLAAQETPQRSPTNAVAGDKQQSDKQQQTKQFDEMVASCLILENQNEVAIAKLAEQKAQHAEVKSMAQMLQKDHGKFITELTKVAKNDYAARNATLMTNLSSTTAEKTTAEKTPADRRVVTDQAHPSANNSDAMQVLQMQIHQEIADECLASARKELGSKQGSEFDMCFIDSQIAMHMQMIVQLKVLGRHVTAQLQPQLQEGQQTAQKHLDHAKQIKKSLADASHKSTAENTPAGRTVK